MPVVGDAYVVVRAITTGFEREVQNALRRANLQNAGQQVSRSFSRGFRGGLIRDSDGLAGAFARIQQDALGAAEAFRRLVTAGYFVGPAIVAIVGAVGALASGLVILVSQVGAAIPSLMALAGAMAAVGFAMAAVKIGFSGIGAALKARSKEATGAGRDNTAALRRVEDAERSLARVIESNRETLVRAHREVTDAEEALTKARKEAAESLQQLNFDAEDAAISEKKASIELEKARERLARIQDLPPNSRARREAELAFAEADLNLRRAKDRNADLTKEQEEANKKGVEGSDKVVEATRQLVEARESEARAVRDGGRAQEDAARALKRAQEDAKKGGGAADDGGFDKLIPEAKAFVDLLIKIKNQFKAVKEAIQRELLPRIGEALQLLVDSYFPTLETLLPRVGAAVGNAAKKFAEIMSAPDVIKSFGDVGETSIYFIERMGEVAGNLAAILIKLLDAAGPLTRRFGDWLVTLTGGWREGMKTEEQMKKLTDIFNYAGDVAAQLGDIFGNIFRGLMNIGKAAAGPGSAGEMLLTSFEGATKKFADFTDRINKDGSLGEYFKKVVPNVEAIGRLFNTIVIEVLKLGGSSGIGKFADSLTRATETFFGALQKISGGLPAMGTFIEKLAELFALFAEAESIRIFFEVLTDALTVLVAFFSNENVQKVLMTTIAFMAFVKAATIMKNVTMFGVKVLAGYVIKFMSLLAFIPGVNTAMVGLTATFRNASVAYTMMGGGLSGVSAAFTTFMAMSGPILIAVAAVVAIFVLAWQNSERFRDAVMGLVGAVRDVLGESLVRITEQLKTFAPSVQSVGDVFRVLGDILAVTIVPLFKVFLVTAIQFFADRVVAVIRVISGLANIFKAIVDVIKAAFALVTGDTDKAKQHIENAFRNLVSGIARIFGGVVQFITAPFVRGFNLVAGAWNNTLGKLKLPSWLGGFSMPTIPTIPNFAKGGTVFPQQGGMLVRVAEAGRPERIEPLDDEGLSKRDRAIIAQLTDGKGGQTFNVYPSPGMDEVELASMISRQLAFQLRAGSV